MALNIVLSICYSNSTDCSIYFDWLQVHINKEQELQYHCYFHGLIRARFSVFFTGVGSKLQVSCNILHPSCVIDTPATHPLISTTVIKPRCTVSLSPPI